MRTFALLVAGGFLGVCLLGLWDLASEVYFAVTRRK
jgi:hypothetical protein